MYKRQEIIVRQPEKEDVVGAVLAELLKFREKSRKIFISAHRITVYNNGISDGSIRKHSIDRMTEIQTFVILQREIGAVSYTHLVDSNAIFIF